MNGLPVPDGAKILTVRQREVLFVSGFDDKTGHGWPVVVQGGTRNSARILAARYGLGAIQMDDNGTASFTANREGCRIYYADRVAAFESRRR